MLPKLKEPAILPQGQLIQKRSYAVGELNFCRLQKSDPLHISLDFDESMPAPEKVVVQFENFLHIVSRPYQFDLGGNKKKYQKDLFLPLTGVTRFKVRYKHKGKWYWDRVPFSYVLVDPDHLRDFRIYTYIPNISGHLDEWKQDVLKIKSLGFNTLQVLPVTRMSTSESPYAAYDLFEVDPSFLNPKDGRKQRAQWKSFVKFVKMQGMHLCLDLVFNNIGIDSRICHFKPEWLKEDPDENDGIQRGGWFDGETWHKWNDLAFLNYDVSCSQTRDDLWRYMRQYALYWTRYAAETGGMIRLDNLHSSHPAFMRWVLGEIRRAYPDVIIFGELFETEDVIKQMVLDYGLNFLLATPWEHKFVPELRTYLSYVHKNATQLRYLFPIISHDSLTPAEEFGSVLSTRARLAFSFLFGPGPSGIVQGVEKGLIKKIPFIGKQGRVLISGEHDFSDLITGLNHLVTEQAVFQQAGNMEFVDQGHDAVIGIVRFHEGTKKPAFFIFSNFDIYRMQEINVDLSRCHAADISLKEVFDAGNFWMSDGVLSVKLAPGDFCVLQCE